MKPHNIRKPKQPKPAPEFPLDFSYTKPGDVITLKDGTRAMVMLYWIGKDTTACDLCVIDDRSHGHKCAETACESHERADGIGVYFAEVEQ